ncbi:MAG: SprB repeat-containing protein, partial [Flavobacteriales bacterium]
FNSAANEDDGTCVYACDYPATQLMIEASSTGDVSCSGYSDGSAVVTVTGGQGSLTYSNGTSTNATGIFNAVPSGDVTITVTDNVGCSVETTLTVGTPDPLVVTASLSDPISCAGESDAVLSGSSTGGTGTVMYSMTAPVDTGSGPYFEMGTDVLLFEGIGVGLYTVYAIDGNGCVDNTPGIQVGQPQPFNLYAQAVAPTTCPDTEDGTVVLNFFGGSGNGTTYSTDGAAYSTENTFTLPPGTYTFYAQDVNGCPDTLTDVMVESPAEFESLAELVSPSCFGEMDGSATVEVQGGTAPLVYVVDGDSLDNVMLTMVGGGDIAIEVVDANGCSYDASVTLSQPAEIVIDAAVTDVNCNGDENGAVTLNASGGTGMGYVYDVDNGGFGPNNEFDGLAAGSYPAVVQDDSGCSRFQRSWQIRVDVFRECGR